MASSTLKRIRQTHLYFGVFISPAILFFAFTGALQTFSLHKTTQGSSYKPPAWIMTLSQLHKNQTITVPIKRSLAPAGGATVAKLRDAQAPTGGTLATPKLAATSMPAPKPKSHIAMKIFFLLVTIGLFTSTFTGTAMAYKYNRNKLLVSGLLVAGVVLPLLLTHF